MQLAEITDKIPSYLSEEKERGTGLQALHIVSAVRISGTVELSKKLEKFVQYALAEGSSCAGLIQTLARSYPINNIEPHTKVISDIITVFFEKLRRWDKFHKLPELNVILDPLLQEISKAEYGPNSVFSNPESSFPNLCHVVGIIIRRYFSNLTVSGLEPKEIASFTVDSEQNLYDLLIGTDKEAGILEEILGAISSPMDKIHHWQNSREQILPRLRRLVVNSPHQSEARLESLCLQSNLTSNLTWSDSPCNSLSANSLSQPLLSLHKDLIRGRSGIVSLWRYKNPVHYESGAEIFLSLWRNYNYWTVGEALKGISQRDVEPSLVASWIENGGFIIPRFHFQGHVEECLKVLREIKTISRETYPEVFANPRFFLGPVNGNLHKDTQDAVVSVMREMIEELRDPNRGYIIRPYTISPEIKTVAKAFDERISTRFNKLTNSITFFQLNFIYELSNESRFARWLRYWASRLESEVEDFDRLIDEKKTFFRRWSNAARLTSYRIDWVFTSAVDECDMLHLDGLNEDDRRDRKREQELSNLVTTGISFGSNGAVYLNHDTNSISSEIISAFKKEMTYAQKKRFIQQRFADSGFTVTNNGEFSAHRYILQIHGSSRSSPGRFRSAIYADIEASVEVDTNRVEAENRDRAEKIGLIDSSEGIAPFF